LVLALALALALLPTAARLSFSLRVPVAATTA
jgi:hypothetical protein